MCEFVWKLPKRKDIRNGGNHPTLYSTKHFQQAVYKNNTRSYPKCIKFQYTHILKFWHHDPNLSSPGQARFYCFPFVHPFLTQSFLVKYLHCNTNDFFFYRAFFCLQLETNFSVSYLEKLNAFCVIARVFFFSFLFICSSNPINLIYWKNPRIILICRSVRLLMGIPSIRHHNKLPTTQFATTEDHMATHGNVKHKAKPEWFLPSDFRLMIHANVYWTTWNLHWMKAKM